MKTLVCALGLAIVPLGCSAAGTSPPGPRSGGGFPLSDFDRTRGSQETGQPQLPRSMKGDTAVPIGVGFTLDPDMAMLNVAWDIQLNDRMAMGPSLQFGGSDERFLFAPTIQIKSFLNTAGPTEQPSRFQPYIQGGLGWAWLDSNRTADGSDFDSNSFLLNGGGGVRYRLNRNYSLGSGALINFVPGRLEDNRWYFSWEVLQLVLHF